MTHKYETCVNYFVELRKDSSLVSQSCTDYIILDFRSADLDLKNVLNLSLSLL